MDLFLKITINSFHENEHEVKEGGVLAFKEEKANYKMIMMTNMAD